MNQRSLSAVTLIAPAVAITTNTTGAAVDIGATYANVGRREMKFVFGAAMTNTTSVICQLQDNTTTVSTDSGWANISGAVTAALTTNGFAAAIHFSTSKRYVRPVTTLAGTTLSAQPVGVVLVENRAS